MRGRTSYRRKTHKGSLILMTILFFAVSAATALALVSQTAAAGDLEETTQETMAMQYVDHIFSIVNRGRERSEKPETTAGAAVQSAPTSQAEEAGVAVTAVRGLVGLSFPALALEDDGHGQPEDRADTETGAGGLGKYSAETTSKDNDDSPLVADAEVLPEPEPGPAAEEEPEPVAMVDTTANQDPVVLIYHTHATESFQPVATGNFHAVDEYGTVRQVGEVMAAALEAKGIAVIHDKTLHDNPSYNQSYSKSLQTVNRYLEEYPSIEIVIDLHRDAAAYSGNVGKTVNIEGVEVATYSLVIGKGNANVASLRAFAGKINDLAADMYPGFSNKVIEKEYRFNQYVADQYILLEVGNNENTIEQAKMTGKYFADVLEAYIIEMNQ